MARRSIACDYWLGDIIFHRIAEERKRGMVTGINICPDGLYYWITWSDGHETKHYPIELTSEFVPDYETSE
ncbi:MAG TPA: hypothetical protein VKF17_16745 [Isosphaeraceae bacterium]|nr:hypothetical protein [Isosphaeraceae bacterium]